MFRLASLIFLSFDVKTIRAEINLSIGKVSMYGGMRIDKFV